MGRVKIPGVKIHLLLRVKINPRNRIPEVNVRNVPSATTHPHRCVKRNLPTHLLEMGTTSMTSMIRRYGRRERTYPAWVEND
jgi:hypothetical protein